jgi:hypothetical protein
MHSISRRRFVRTLTGVPFLMAAPWRAFGAPKSGQNYYHSSSDLERLLPNRRVRGN